MNQYMPNYLKTKNRLLVYDLMRMYGKTSRAELVRITGMSFPTILKVVDKMMELGIVTETDETEPPAGAGRRGRLLCFNARAYYAIGIEFEGQIATIGLVDLLGFCSHIHSFTLTDSGHHVNMEVLNHQMHHLLDIAEEENIPVLGIGIGFPSMVNAEQNVILRARAYGIEQETPFKTAFPEFFAGIDLPVFVDNEVNYACKGETFLRRPDASYNSLLYITLGTGCGCGLMLDGKLWYGTNHKSGEIGHMLADRQEIPQTLPPEASNLTNLESRINLDSIMQRFGIDLREPQTLSHAMQEEIITFITPYISYTITNLVMLLDINHCVLAGIIPFALGIPFMDRLQKTIDNILSGNSVMVELPAYKNTGIVGAGVTVFEKRLEELFREA